MLGILFFLGLDSKLNKNNAEKSSSELHMFVCTKCPTNTRIFLCCLFISLGLKASFYTALEMAAVQALVSASLPLALQTPKTLFTQTYVGTQLGLIIPNAEKREDNRQQGGDE